MSEYHVAPDAVVEVVHGVSGQDDCSAADVCIRRSIEPPEVVRKCARSILCDIDGGIVMLAALGEALLRHNLIAMRLRKDC